MVMIDLKETKVYKPFMHDELLMQNIKLQESLGFGRVREVALRDEEDGRFSERDIELHRQCNELATKFPVLDLKNLYRGDGFNPWDHNLVVNKVPIPVFDTTQRGGTYGCSYRRDSFQIRCSQINELMAEDSGCEAVDWVKTPPEWALIAFDPPQCKSKHNCLAMQMHKDVQAEFKAKLTDGEVSKMYKDSHDSQWWDTSNARMREDLDLEWVAGIPMFPSTALELAGRVKKISDSARFMLLFQPEWEYKSVELPKLDPVLIVWQPTEYPENKGVWFKIAEWGRDVMELE